MYGPKWPCLLMYMSHEIDVGTCTKETLSDFHEWCRVTRHPRLFHRLTGFNGPPGFGASQQNVQRGWRDVVAGFVISRERKCTFSLDFLPFGPSVLDGARSKVDLRDEGYA